MKKFWSTFALAGLMMLTACAPVGPAGNTAGAGATQPQVEATATAAVSAPATPAPGEVPTDAATPVPGGQTAEGSVDMGQLVRQILVQQLQLSHDQIEIVSVEPVEWPDACLGISNPDVMCAQVITPGYRVILAVDGQQYEYHTNEDGSNVQLAAAPEANIGDTLLIWQQTTDMCQAATFGTTGVSFGYCMGVQMGVGYANEERMAQLGEIIASFAPFQADTPAGVVTLNGQGTAEATPAQQRMVAEWARLAQLEAASGRSGASWGLALAWHREGGIAGFCDDLTIDVTGLVYASTCKGQNPQTLADRWLGNADLEQIYAWVDQYGPFEVEQTDDAQADGMTVRMVFSGAGSVTPDEEEQQAMLDFAAEMYTRLAQE